MQKSSDRTWEWFQIVHIETIKAAYQWAGIVTGPSPRQCVRFVPGGVSVYSMHAFGPASVTFMSIW